MAEQMRPTSPKEAPNPAHSYERSDPHREAGMGRLDSDASVPAERRDELQDSAPNRSDPTRQINSEESMKAGERQDLNRSMREDEPTDTDLAPQDIRDPERKRYPRIGGKGGTPDEGESTRKG
jgi:hypothetical protein